MLSYEHIFHMNGIGFYNYSTASEIVLEIVGIFVILVITNYRLDIICYHVCYHS